MAKITVKIGTLSPAQLKAALQKSLEAAARKSVDVVRRRTAKGLDSDGKPMKAYTKQYAARRKRKGLKTTPVDLTVTGQMIGGLRPLSVDSARGGFTYGITGKAGDIALYVSKLREFLPIRSHTEVGLVAKAFGNEFQRQLKALKK